jgi:hypothetical protein
MNKTIGISLLLLSSIMVSAIEGNQVEYIGGSIQTITPGAVGHLDLSSDTILLLQYSDGNLAIPYAAIESYEYSHEVAHHLGVAPAIAVGLVKKRQRRHYFRVSYRDQNKASQIIVFEVPKQMPRTLLAVLQTRSPQGCKPAAVCNQKFHLNETRQDQPSANASCSKLIVC